ncbi:3-deoxy-7-phosphoheptulonate synthase [Cokeromyces recurvatus]|uniref:3-deoxy-7-phosphoheptulonate synthase n=1 Tax=Cokeromyces recurvatus TaxID=90255 RepID=UPI002220F359|nr:3-deoxy-7-phosphoheptulonate synthase [Cokeromyces recurvatus]KAI7907446.1 3-deoxy-7-phosphoheptulonate synthase [Cokeromyces recurvatus]
MTKSSLEDLRITGYNALLSPNYIKEEFPISEVSIETTMKARKEVSDIILQKDDRIFVIVGPCSIHDTIAAKEYAQLLLEAKERYQNEIVIIMRSYFEKPRTVVGWKGLINDPDIDESFNINKGLRIGRGLLNELTNMGMPVSVELLDTISPQYLADLISWGAIGARTTESQLHRELASGVSFPVGFKNGTDGNLGVAIDGVRAAAVSHHFLGINSTGTVSITHTTGNPDCHVILRGGTKGPNFEESYIQETKSKLEKEGLPISIVVDCSHGNSKKDYRNQPKVAQSIADQIAKGENALVGLMLESHLREGNQSVPTNGPCALEYGVSITDSCINWKDTELVLQNLAEAVKARRNYKNSK